MLDIPKATIAAVPPADAPTHAVIPELDPLPLPKDEGPLAALLCTEPAVYLEPCAPQRGDTPMIRNWKMLSLCSLLTAVTFVPEAAVAGEPNNELKKSVDKLITRIGALETKLTGDLKKLEEGALADIKKSADKAVEDVAAVYAEQKKQKKQLDDQKYLIDLLTARIDNLEKKLVAGGAPAPSVVDKAFLEEFRTTMKTLTDTLARLGPTTERKSMSAPANGGVKSLVRISNSYPDELLFIINGVGHRLPPRSGRDVDVPPGTVTYEVFSTRFGSLERRSLNLAGGHTFNLLAQ
jgi:hypothetical protein